MKKKKSKKKEILYAVIDKDNADLILCVGSIEEVSKYAGTNPKVIRSAIFHAEEKGYSSKYIKIEIEDEKNDQ